MKLEDLLGKSIDQMTDEELRDSIADLKRLRPGQEPTLTVKVKPTHKTNKEKQAEDLIKQLNPEQLALLLKKVNIK